ncbi:hypothetical protein SAY87_021525 [Trapa incisa]|uniref:Uncharacterized protein n=1 Tax=Trapa incisa TaxID=236973 RepID=A0AAN7JTJ3_9MYRT|nr:hypothetical protein SAY87_021525 [Trapa incisa]
MAPQIIAFLLTTFLFLNTKVSSTDEKAKDQAHSPLKAPAPEKPHLPLPPQPSAKPPTAPLLPPVRSKEDCIQQCDRRCALHSRKRVCLRACMTCCDRCKCVPPGTFGNREMCGKCYTDMTTHGNRTKCP